MVYYDSWNSIWKAVFQDGKTLFYAIWCQCDRIEHKHRIYYVTFQMESGDRMEFQVSGIEYGMLAEGDTGELTFQGTRYLAFER